MEYYHDLVTQKSWEELTKLVKFLDFVLIGGWATYLYTKSLKSKDIDIIIGFDQLKPLEERYSLNKNERLKKYEAVKEEVQIDIYLPHFSALGIPVEELIQHFASTEGFKVVSPDYLFALKVHTLGQRGRSPKGRKDLLDLISLGVSGKCNLQEVRSILKAFDIDSSLAQFFEMLKESDRVEELGLNPHTFSQVKKMLLGDLG